MSKAFWISSLCGVMFLLGCSDISVKTDPVSNVFERHKVYAWYDVEREFNSLVASEAHQQVMQAVDAHLQQKGYQKVDKAEADFYVNYHLSVEDKMTLETIDVYEGYGPGFVLRRGEGVSNENYIAGQETKVKYYRKGTLVLDMVDPQTNHLFWRGEADKQMQDRLSASERSHAIKTAVSKILASIPARK